jgi:hypothetical protein
MNLILIMTLFFFFSMIFGEKRSSHNFKKIHYLKKNRVKIYKPMEGIVGSINKQTTLSL